jgi:hypothetical protein
MKRGLTYLEAMDYVGVKRRTFDVQWRPHLVAIPQGTSLIFDREDLDRLFDQFKQDTRRLAPPVGTSHAPVPEAYVPGSMEPMPAAVSSLADRRPTSRKGVERWVVKTASTKTQRAGGESTNSTAVNAFKAVSDRIRRPKLG